LNVKSPLFSVARVVFSWGRRGMHGGKARKKETARKNWMYVGG
jgi:hypothetical protein